MPKESKGQPTFFVHPGASEHYAKGLEYDVRYEGRTEDVGFYTSLAKKRPKVLEYGAGTGRLTFPLVTGGAKVVAVDLADGMLSVLRERAKTLTKSEASRLRIERGDMRTFETREKFELVVVGFHTFCHLYSFRDVVAFLSRAHAHLAPGGMLAFDVPMPRVDAAGYEALSQVCVTEMESPSGNALLTQRWYQPEELRMHLHYAGFVKTRFFGDFSQKRPDSDTDFLQLTALRGARPKRLAC